MERADLAIGRLKVDEVFMGNVLQAGLGMYAADDLRRCVPECLRRSAAISVNRDVFFQVIEAINPGRPKLDYHRVKWRSLSPAAWRT